MKKSFKDLAKQMNSLEESKQGQLKGGFASFGNLAKAQSLAADKSVSVTVAIGETCRCKCKIKVATPSL